MNYKISHIKNKLNLVKTLSLFLFFLLLFDTTNAKAENVADTSIDEPDYVLIINSYTESSEWSNNLIFPIYESLIANKSDLSIYTEHMNMLMINNNEEMAKYKEVLFAKYAYKKPEAVILLGNTPWITMQKELESLWANTPVLLCAEMDYNGPAEAYIEKYAIPEELRTPVTNYNGNLKLTVLEVPVYIKQTIDLMKQTIKGMNKIMFLSDKRYISTQIRAEIEQTIKSDYPKIELENLISDDYSTNKLTDKLRNADPTTGILYFSWFKKNKISDRVVLSTNDYKMFSRYTNLPIFSLTDSSIGTTGMVGGYFLNVESIKELILSTFNDVMANRNNAKVTIANSGTPTAVFNHAVLTSKGISDSIYPEDTYYYMKELTFWQEYKYWIIPGFVALTCIFALLIFRLSMLAKMKTKQAEKLLLMQNYSSLFENMPIAYSKQQIRYGANGEITNYVLVETNPYFKQYFTSANNAVELPGGDSNSSSFKEFAGLYELAIADKKAITVQYYHQATERFFSMMIVPSKIQGYMDVFYVDNTELASTQQLLRTLNHKLSMALEVANITPWKWDLDRGTIVCDVNRAVRENSEVSADDQLSVPYQEYFSKICKRDIERVKQAYYDLLSGKINKIKEEYRVFVHNNNKKSYEWVEAQAMVDKRDDTGRPISLIGSSLLISDRKKMESDLIDAKNKAEESNRLKSAFLANMSHEIRTPLNAIVGFSEVLASAEDEEEKREYVSIIENNNTLLLQLISDILDLSKIEAGTLELVYSDMDMTELFIELETSFNMRNKESGIEIIYENAKQDNIYINTDKNRLTQVVINMVNNSMKFTKKGDIRFGHKLKDNKTLYFYVKDTGCGIASDKLESVFGRFVKLNNFVQGTGLGLSICQTIVYNMGGEIGVESEEGHGTTFWFTIPYNPVKIIEVAKKEIIQKEVEKNKLKVLIAEDNASNYKLFETILKGEYIIYHAWDGEEAVSMFKEHSPHIILMDINMPKLNGYEATKRIREISESIPIIAVTAYAYTSDEQRIIENGFDGYTAKPINSQMLKSQMINLLKRQLIFM